MLALTIAFPFYCGSGLINNVMPGCRSSWFSQKKKKISFSRYSQVNTLHIACAMGMESCRELVKSWYRQWMKNPNNNLWVELISHLLCPESSLQPVLTWPEKPAWRLARPVCVWDVGHGFFFSNSVYIFFDVEQDPSQLEEYSLLQRHCLWRRGGVGLCLENVQVCHFGIWSFPA